MPTPMTEGIAVSVARKPLTATTPAGRSGVTRSCRSQPTVRSLDTATPIDSTPITAP